MDVYEYPTQKEKMRVGYVTWIKAIELCAAQRKHLCTGVEWDRACLGLENRIVRHGSTYERNKCNTAIRAFGPEVCQPAPIKPSGIF